MINLLLRLNTDRLLYLFFCPLVLILAGLLFVNSDSKLEISVVLLLFGLWVQGYLFFYFTYFVGRKLILLKDRKFASIKNGPYQIHSLFNFLIFTIGISIWMISVFKSVSDTIVAFTCTLGLVSEIFRARSFSKLLVSIEFRRKARLKDYVLTWYLAINPLIGIWSLHYRIISLMKIKVGSTQEK